ncbi:MAG: SDR family NAD(P)-dependent oxidoreductase [Moraxellaceae bacterium]|nr:SDR family NAD(P)-dependent oxidoreductase [Pseudobdellovibrionaceae bacterium]
MKTVLITGISTGIGRATAESFLEQGHLVIGAVREFHSVETLKSKYGSKLILWKCNFLNLTEIDSIHNLLSENKIMQIDILINNAGMALSAPFQHQDFSEVQNTITTNVLAVMKLTQVLISYLIPAKGRIINISSISGVGGTPFLAGYCASKHAVEGFSESLRRELNLYGIKVILIGPGSIQTPIWSKGFEAIRMRYQNSAYQESFDRFIEFASHEKAHALPPSVVVKDILHATFSESPKIRYSPVPRKFQNVFLPWILPRFVTDYMICRALGLRIKKY